MRSIEGYNHFSLCSPILYNDHKAELWTLTLEQKHIWSIQKRPCLTLFCPTLISIIPLHFCNPQSPSPPPVITSDWVRLSTWGAFDMAEEVKLHGSVGMDFWCCWREMNTLQSLNYSQYHNISQWKSQVELYWVIFLIINLQFFSQVGNLFEMNWGRYRVENGVDNQCWSTCKVQLCAESYWQSHIFKKLLLFTSS